MKFLTDKTSELPVWQLLLLTGFVFLVALVLKDAFTTQNLVVTPGGSSFIKPTYMGPLSSEGYANAAKRYDDKQNKKDAAAEKK